MQKNKKVSSRITGADIARFKMRNGLSDSRMGDLFGLSPGKITSIMSSGSAPVADPVCCYLYRQYTENPHLVEKDIDMSDFYEQIGGKDVISGADFALTLGRELSAYVRYFSGGKPTQSLRTMIGNAVKLSNGDYAEAFETIKELFRKEVIARGYSPLETRKWGKGT